MRCPFAWRNPLLLLAILLMAFTASSQVSSIQLLKDDSLALESLLKITTSHFETDKSLINGQNKKYILEEYKERYENIKSKCSKKEFVTDPLATKYLEQMVSIILAANPSLKTLKPNVVFSKVYWPNACSFGEGTIAFNISLFNRLKNESQVAFVLCHELSHYYLNHSNKAIDQYVNTVYSDEFQKELKTIQKSQYQQNKRLTEIAKGITYKSRKHGRSHETEADSMALELLKNTGYDVRESISCLALLDSIDKDKYAGNLQLQQQLNFEKYPFQQRWVRSRSVSMGEAMANYNSENKTDEKKDTDSLKTHPDCSMRITQLQQKANTYYSASQKIFIISQQSFDSLSRLFDYQIIEYCYNQDEVSRALYFALQMYPQHTGDVYLTTMIGQCFNRIYDEQKAHTLGRIIDAPSADDQSEYRTFLQFLQTVKLQEVAAIAYYFMDKNRDSAKSPQAIKVFDKSKNIYKEQLD